MRKCVLVAGMHRSGTSAFSRVLNLLGCDLAGDLVPPRENDNPKGFWEGRAVVELNKAMDDGIGFLWNDVRPVPSNWYDSPEKADFLDQAVAALNADFAESNLFTIKDPRICRYLPFWREALSRMDVEPVVVLPIRHPDAVAASIETRNLVPPASSHMSWLRHVLEAERTSRDIPRSILRYDDVLRDWRGTMARISDQTGLTWPKDPASVAAEIDAFIDPDQRHHSEADNSALPDWVANVQGVMARFAEDRATDSDPEKLDTVRAAFDQTIQVIAPIANQSTTSARQHLQSDKVRRRLAADRDRLRAAEKDRRRVAEATITDLKKNLEKARQDLKVTTRDLQDMTQESARFRSEVANLSSTLLDQSIGTRTVEESTFKALRRMARGTFFRMVQRTQLKKQIETLDATDLFDPEWYLATYPDVKNQGLHPAAHYILVGASAGRNPSPNFDSARYRAERPKLSRYHRNPLIHHLKRSGQIETKAKWTPKAVAPKTAAADEDSARFHELRSRIESGPLYDVIKKATDLEPLIAQSLPSVRQMKLPPYFTPANSKQLSAMIKAQELADHRPARIVILVNRPRWGGGRRLEGHIAHALAETVDPSEIMMIATDNGGDLPPGRLPEGGRYVDFASVTLDLQPRPSRGLLIEYLRSLAPDAIYNINSQMLWNAFDVGGRALTDTVPVYGCLFCNEQMPNGYWTGFPVRFFSHHFDKLAGVCCDSHDLKRWLIERYRVPPQETDKITVLSAPVDPSIPVAAAPPEQPGRRRQVFWAGRFDRQKRLDIAYGVAKSLPEVDFRLWGEPVGNSDAVPEIKPDNVTHEGVYAQFEDLPLSEADAWLYTAAWDGVPSALLEVAMTGVPLVGSLAGGTGEVLMPEYSHPVADIEDVTAYADGLKAIFADPAGAREKALALRNHLIAERTENIYRDVLVEMMSADHRRAQANV